MTVGGYLAILRKHWAIVGVFVLAGVSAASAFVFLSTPKYEASAQLFVSANDTGGLAANLQSAA